MQRKYITDLLTKFSMINTKPVSTPLDANNRLTLSKGEQLQDPTQFRTLIGCLQYLAFTRPDLAFGVNKLSQYMHRPTVEHWTAAKRVLRDRYLTCTTTHGILLRKK